MKPLLIEEYIKSFHRLSGTQVLLEDFRTAYDRFIAQGVNDVKVKQYLDAFRIIKNKGYSSLKDPKDRIENVVRVKFTLNEPEIDKTNPSEVEKLKLFRSNIDNYEKFTDLMCIVKYVKSQAITDIPDDDTTIQIDGQLIYDQDNVEIYYAPSGHACFSYRTNKKTITNTHYGWCIAGEPSANAYGRYRFGEKKYTIYFVHAKDKPFSDKWHIFVVQVANTADINKPDQNQYLVTSARNDGDNWWTFNHILAIEPRIRNLQHLFKSVPLDPDEERIHKEFLGSTGFEYCTAPYRRKQTYIDNLQHQYLDDRQFFCTPETLQLYYIDTGKELSDQQFDSIKDNKNVLRRYTVTTIGRFVKSDGKKELKKNQILILASANIDTLKKTILPIILKNYKNIASLVIVLPYEKFSVLKEQLITGLLATWPANNKQDKIKGIDSLLDEYPYKLDERTKMDLLKFRVGVQVPVSIQILSDILTIDNKLGTELTTTHRNVILKKYIRAQGKEELTESEALLLSGLQNEDFQKYIVPYLSTRNIFLFAMYGIAGTVRAMGKDIIDKIPGLTAEEILHRTLNNQKFFFEDDIRILLWRMMEDDEPPPTSNQRVIREILRYNDLSDAYENKILKYLDKKLNGDFNKLKKEHQEFLLNADNEYFRERVLPLMSQTSQELLILNSHPQNTYEFIEKIGMENVLQMDFDALDKIAEKLTTAINISNLVPAGDKEEMQKIVKIITKDLIDNIKIQPLPSAATKRILNDNNFLELAQDELINLISKNPDIKLPPNEISILQKLKPEEVDYYILPHLKNSLNLRNMLPYSKNFTYSLKKYGHMLDGAHLNDLAKWISGTIQDDKDKKYEIITRLLIEKNASLNSLLIKYFPLDDKEFTDKYLTPNIMTGLFAAKNKSSELLNKIGIDKILELGIKNIINIIDAILLFPDPDHKNTAEKIMNYTIQNKSSSTANEKAILLMRYAGFPGNSENRSYMLENLLDNIDKINPKFLKSIDIQEVLDTLLQFEPESDMFERTDDDEDGSYTWIDEEAYHTAVITFKEMVIKTMIPIIRNNPQTTNNQIFAIVDINYEDEDIYDLTGELFAAAINSGKELDDQIVGFIANELDDHQRNILIKILIDEPTKEGYDFISNFEEEDFKTIFRRDQKDVLNKFNS